MGLYMAKLLLISAQHQHEEERGLLELIYSVFYSR